MKSLHWMGTIQPGRYRRPSTALRQRGLPPLSKRRCLPLAGPPSLRPREGLPGSKPKLSVTPTSPPARAPNTMSPKPRITRWVPEGDVKLRKSYQIHWWPGTSGAGQCRSHQIGRQIQSATALPVRNGRSSKAARQEGRGPPAAHNVCTRG